MTIKDSSGEPGPTQVALKPIRVSSAKGNREQGKAFEKQVKAKLDGEVAEVGEQITIKTGEETVAVPDFLTNKAYY
jgi:hypothetical protein